MYKIKQIPEDFIVNEINKLNLTENGQYSYYLLKKTDYNTNDAINVIADKFKIKPKFINFAGTKDKVAITSQYISINRGPRKSLNLKDIALEFIGQGNERLNLGNLIGNEFIITVRNIDKLPKLKSEFINYFDEQRFGVNKNNHIIGKHIIKCEFDKACILIKETKPFLLLKPADFVGALKSIPKQILRLYLHSYQSDLWNLAAEKLSKKTKTQINLPIIGFSTSFKDKDIKEIYEPILEKENIKLTDFIIRQLPHMSLEGDLRELYIMPTNLKISKLLDDELNPNKKKAVLSFSLSKGAYATNIIKQLFI